MPEALTPLGIPMSTVQQWASEYDPQDLQASWESTPNLGAIADKLGIQGQKPLEQKDFQPGRIGTLEKNIGRWVGATIALPYVGPAGAAAAGEVTGNAFEKWFGTPVDRLDSEAMAQIQKEKPPTLALFGPEAGLASTAGEALLNTGLNLQNLTNRAVDVAGGAMGLTSGTSADETNRLRNMISGTQNQDFVTSTLRGGAESIGTGLALGAVGGPAGVIAGFGAQAANEAYTDAKDSGYTPAQATAYAALQGGIESGLTYGFGKLLGHGFEKNIARALGRDVAANPLLKQTAKQVVGQYFKETLKELPEEFAIQAASDTAEQFFEVNGRQLGDWTWPQFFQSLAKTAASTAVAASGGKALSDYADVRAQNANGQPASQPAAQGTPQPSPPASGAPEPTGTPEDQVEAILNDLVSNPGATKAERGAREKEAAGRIAQLTGKPRMQALLDVQAKLKEQPAAATGEVVDEHELDQSPNTTINVSGKTVVSVRNKRTGETKFVSPEEAADLTRKPNFAQPDATSPDPTSPADYASTPPTRTVADIIAERKAREEAAAGPDENSAAPDVNAGLFPNARKSPVVPSENDYAMGRATPTDRFGNSVQPDQGEDLGFRPLLKDAAGALLGGNPIRRKVIGTNLRKVLATKGKLDFEDVADLANEGSGLGLALGDSIRAEDYQGIIDAIDPPNALAGPAQPVADIVGNAGKPISGEVVEGGPNQITIWKDGRPQVATVTSVNEADGWRVKRVKVTDPTTGMYESIPFPEDAATGYGTGESARDAVFAHLKQKFPMPTAPAGLPSPAPLGLPAPRSLPVSPVNQRAQDRAVEKKRLLGLPKADLRAEYEAEFPGQPVPETTGEAARQLTLKRIPANVNDGLFGTKPGPSETIAPQPETKPAVSETKPTAPETITENPGIDIPTDADRFAADTSVSQEDSDEEWLNSQMGTEPLTDEQNAFLEDHGDLHGTLSAHVVKRGMPNDADDVANVALMNLSRDPNAINLANDIATSEDKAVVNKAKNDLKKLGKTYASNLARKLQRRRDAQKRQAVSGAASIDATDNEGNQTGSEPAAPETEIDVNAERMGDILENQPSWLDDKEHATLRMKYVEGLTNDQIGEAYGESRETVRQRLKKIKGKIETNVKLFDPTTKFRIGAKSKTKGPFTEQSIYETFPGAKVTRSATGNGYHVEVGDSYFTIEVVDDLGEVDWDALERQHGVKIPEEQRKKLGPAGAFTMVLPDGTRHDGLGLILMHAELANETTLPHEALHLAKSAGIISDAEYQALVEKYGGTGTAAEQEERVAKAMEAKRDPDGIFKRIQRWISRLMAKWGLTKYDAEDVRDLMQTSAFWARAKTPGGDATGTKYQLSPQDIVSRDLLAERSKIEGAPRVGKLRPADPMEAAIYPDPAEQIEEDRPAKISRARQEGAELRQQAQASLSDARAAFDRQPTDQNLKAVQNAEAHLQDAKAEERRLVEEAAQLPLFGTALETTRGMKQDARNYPKYQLRGRPDLANPATDAGARELVDEVDEERNQAGIPNKKGDDVTQAEADAILKDPVKAEADIRAATQLSDAQTIAAKTLLNRKAAKAMQSGNQKDITEAMRLIEAYRDTGTEQGRALRQRQDPVESPAERLARMISEAILEPPQAIREKRTQLRKDGNDAAADKLNEEWAKRFKDLKEKLKALGIDIENLNEAGYSKRKAAQVLGVIATVKASGWDKAYEYWRNAILSAPTTQVTNMVGNAANAAWHFTAERFMEAVVNTGLQRPEGAQWGEYTHLLGGILPGLTRGAQNFMQTRTTEQSAFDEQQAKQSTPKAEITGPAIEGTKGRVIRWPQRLLLAADDLAKTLFAHMEVGAMAYRIAKAEGKTGRDMQDRIAELSRDPESAAWARAYNSAIELTFQQEGGRFSQGLKRSALAARRNLPGLRYIIPFVTTPINIFEQGLKKTPLGTINAGLKMYQNYKDGEHVLKGMAPDIAQQLLAWGAVLAFLANDEEDPWITGTNVGGKAAGADAQYRVPQAQSVKIGGKWVSYSRIEPFATAISSIVDWVDAAKSGEAGRMAMTPFNSLTSQFKDKTFMEGLGDLFEVVNSEDPAQSSAKWASGFTASWVPNIVRSLSRETSTTYNNRRVWGNGQDWWAHAGKRALQQTELSAFEAQPNYDVWGRPAKRSFAGESLGADWLYRIMVPAKVQSDDVFVADRLLMNYNNQNPDDEALPRLPQPVYTVKGEKQFMTEAQYSDFLKLSGETARKALERVPLDADHPTREDVDWIGDVLERSREVVKKSLIKQWSGDKSVGNLDSQVYADVVIDEMVEKKRMQATGAFGMPRFQRGETQQDFMSRREDWLERGDKARQWLQAHPEAVQNAGINRGLFNAPTTPANKPWMQQINGQ